ncbi:MAG: hypothetical protein J6V53_06845 [Alphaproteobacteria bacterium]|nr:hypothetical protein [Alphaproteobacteria bacterium]
MKKTIVVILILFCISFFLHQKEDVFFHLKRIVAFLYEKDILTSPIPKKIHYVWVGGEIPADVQKNIENWRKKMPDYEIKKWDETNCNININPFLKDAYAKKEWRFVSDWCRLVALKKEGGIYLDTDIYLNRSLKPLLTKDLILTWERKEHLSAGIIAVTKDHPFIQNLINYYNELKEWSYIPAPVVWTQVFNLVKEDLESYRILPANILMFNFNDKENYATHFYSNGSGNLELNNQWYKYFQKKFIHENALFLNGRKEPSWIIFYDRKRYYIVQKDDNGFFKATGEEGIYHKINQQENLYFLMLENKFGLTETYTCVENACGLH